MYEVARRLAERRVDVTVLVPDSTRSRLRTEERDHVQIRRTPAWPRNRDYLWAPGIYRLLSRGEWDIVHVQSWHTAVAPLAMIAALRASKPYLVTPHGRGYAPPIRRLFRPLQRRALAPLLRRAEYVVALTEPERDGLVAELGLEPERVRVVPNGSDLAEHLDLAHRSCASDRTQKPVIVSPGRLERFKGHHLAIAALPHLLESYPDARLRIVGSGPYERELRRCAAEHGVAERVTVEAYSMDERPQLAAALATADVGVLLSEYETQPLAVLELAALGVPVVVAAAPGLRELAAAGIARAVPAPASPGDLAKAIALALECPRNAALPQLPSWDATTADLIGLYESVLGRRLAPT